MGFLTSFLQAEPAARTWRGFYGIPWSRMFGGIVYLAPHKNLWVHMSCGRIEQVEIPQVFTG
jgi:hypothetical protein